MPINITAQEYAEKYARRIKAAGQDMIDGVNKVTVAPTQQAAAKQTKMLQNLTAAVTSGKWANGLKKVTLDKWKSDMIDKGVGRVSAGVDASMGKITDFAQQIIPHISAAQAKVSAMPDLTLSDSIQRAATFMTEMAKFQKK